MSQISAHSQGRRGLQRQRVPLPSRPALTSWLETSPWSFLVMPSPMADFIRRESEGSTLMGG